MNIVDNKEQTRKFIEELVEEEDIYCNDFYMEFNDSVGSLHVHLEGGERAPEIAPPASNFFGIWEIDVTDSHTYVSMNISYNDLEVLMDNDVDFCASCGEWVVDAEEEGWCQWGPVEMPVEGAEIEVEGDVVKPKETKMVDWWECDDCCPPCDEP